MKTLNTFWVLGHRITTAVSTGNYDLVQIETPAHTPGPPPHLHQKYTEFFLVTEGEVEFLLNGERKVLKAGSSVNIPPGSAHTYRNNSDQACKMVNIHSPKGFMDFFKTLGISALDPHAKENSVAPESIEKVITMADQYDIEFQKEEA
jgi:quercetin dioxygenase-like cupin family protein